jgi:two-component system, OmpR family, response regulator
MLGKRILVVDDNVDAAEAVAMLVESEGHEVRTVHTGRAAVAEALRWVPEVVVLDIGLPDMDGCDVAREITALALAPAPLLIALSGHGRPSDLRQAKDAGFDHHLLKPAEPQALFALFETRVPG